MAIAGTKLPPVVFVVATLLRANQLPIGHVFNFASWSRQSNRPSKVRIDATQFRHNELRATASSDLGLNLNTIPIHFRQAKEEIGLEF